MKVDKKIKEMPWPEPWSGNPQQHFYITLAWPVVNHERLLVLTFLQNKGEKGGNTRRDFRLICSKKQMAISVLYKGERQGRRHELYRACGVSPRWAYPEISPKAEETLAKWLGKSESGNHFLPELEQWVNRAICAELQRERDARGEIRDEAVNLCPEPLPDGLERYIRLQVLPNDRVLLYKKGNVRGKCYCCGRDVKARHQRFKQNELVRCPECGEIVTCYLKDSDRFKVDYVQNIASIQKGTDGETVFIRQWHLKRDPEAKWKDIPAFLEEICRYAIRGNHVAKWQCEAKETWYYSSYRYATSGWKRMQNHSEVYDGSYYFYCPDNWEEVFSDTSLQYCPLPEYMNDPEDTKNFRNVIRYLMDWAKYPMIEKFWKAGYTKLVHEHVSGLRKDERHLIRWNRDSFREALKFPTRLLKIYPPEEWKMWRIKKTENAWNAAVSGRILEKDIPEMVRSEAELAHISDAIGYASLHKILRYIAIGIAKEQTVRDRKPGVYHGPYRTPMTYRDYLRDCVALGLNLNDKSVLFPPNLEQAHQRTLSQVKYRADEAKRTKFAREVERLRWMEWEQDGLLIRLPVDGAELVAEGEYLHHCVGGYADRMADGKTTILLIRRSEAPDIPYYTLEWLNGHVQQCRTERNGDYRHDKSVEAFVNAWVKRIKKRKNVAGSAA